MRARSFILLFSLLFISTGLRANLACHSHFLTKNKLEDPVKLPEPGSKEYGTILNSVKSEFQDKGYAVVDLREYLQKLDEDLFNSMPAGEPFGIQGERAFYKKDGRQIITVPSTEWQKKTIEKIEDWFRGILKSAVTDKFSDRRIWEARFFTKSGDGVKVEGWHVDNGVLAITLALRGAGTEVLGLENKCQDCKPVIVPAGQALIFFAAAAGKLNLGTPLVHQTPKIEDERLLLVFRYYESLK
jgi:hypothetical protein